MNKKITGYEAINKFQAEGGTLCKYSDPAEEAREGLTTDEAEEIVMDDPGLIYWKK
jgi:hypothetical protein